MLKKTHTLDVVYTTGLSLLLKSIVLLLFNDGNTTTYYYCSYSYWWRTPTLTQQASATATLDDGNIQFCSMVFFSFWFTFPHIV